MAPYVADVAVRWSDQDAYGHVNHARVVTLLEDARTGLLFDAATRAGVAAFEAGLLVAALDVAYRRPIPWTPAGVRVAMTAQDVRAASFRVAYRLLLPDGEGAWDEAKPAVTATTQLVPYELATARPRRLTAEEREFLAGYTEDGRAA
ncbi:acyl-CoA thioesterase [Actinomycetospora straminea]|uniref:Thioesterase family protein n=1 Tax=Actinomycetospora straminea TaxID=663607 RepID=A0ABP9FAW3_9PSEU|nr:thioesterase family protein [Actinomycetospora straminea]MDD7935410.1 thioesterase family protein [Actinomycetospora straminea]